jgi:hypothetical protein
MHQPPFAENSCLSDVTIIGDIVDGDAYAVDTSLCSTHRTTEHHPKPFRLLRGASMQREPLLALGLKTTFEVLCGGDCVK